MNKDSSTLGVFADAEPSEVVQQFVLKVFALHEPCGERVVPKPLV